MRGGLQAQRLLVEGADGERGAIRVDVQNIRESRRYPFRSGFSIVNGQRVRVIQYRLQIVPDDVWFVRGAD